MAEEKEAAHPLDRQNALERDIQLKGSKDPDNFKMPDGRTLSEVRRANEEVEDAEYQKEIQMVARRTREMSIPEFQKGEKIVMTKTGNLIDVTEPAPIESSVTLAKSRTTMADIEAGAIKPLRERTAGESSGQSGETATSSGVPTSTPPSAVTSSTAAPTTGSTTPSPGSSSTPSSSSGT